MKVFISWSGTLSRSLAEILREWLPTVVQRAKPFYSRDDIEHGARWNATIAAELEGTQLGLICLTSDNLTAPWIMFEAGALSKSVIGARVVPLLFGLSPSDIEGPLAQFQAAPFDADEMKRVVEMLNATLGPDALEPKVLDRTFERAWPELDAAITAVMAARDTIGTLVNRPNREILEEILELSRALYFAQSRPPLQSFDASLINRLLTDCYTLAVEASRGVVTPGMAQGFISLLSPIEYIMVHTSATPGEKAQISNIYESAKREISRIVDTVSGQTTLPSTTDLGDRFRP